MNSQNRNNQIDDEISLARHFPDKLNGADLIGVSLSFNYADCEELISLAALKLIQQDINLILPALAQTHMIKGAVFPGENHGGNEDTPDDWVKLEGRVEAVDAAGRVTKAHLLFKFNLTDSVESISLPAARKFQKAVNTLMENITR